MRKFWAIFSFFLAACESHEPKDYIKQMPVLNFKEFMNGKLEAWGMFQDATGTVVQRFRIDMDASWTGDEGILKENFYYMDGTTQYREWQMRKVGDTVYTGTASDVEGVAQGDAGGPVMRWRYSLMLPFRGKEYAFACEDWMFLMNDQTMLNRIKVKKFGLKVGEITLVIRKI